MIFFLFQIDISHFLTPLFHPSFVEVLRILEQQDTEMKQERAFKRFVRDYGTHYLSSAFLGAKMSAITYYTSYERLKLGKQHLQECNGKQAFSKFKLDVNEEESNKKSMNLSQCWSDGDANQVQDQVRTRLVTFGTKSPSDISKWSEEEITPIPIKFELTPIVNLFNPSALDERYNITSSTILKWFLPLYLRHCKVSKYQKI